MNDNKLIQVIDKASGLAAGIYSIPKSISIEEFDTLFQDMGQDDFDEWIENNPDQRIERIFLEETYLDI